MAKLNAPSSNANTLPRAERTDLEIGRDTGNTAYAIGNESQDEKGRLSLSDDKINFTYQPDEATRKDEVLSLESIDPALNRKMHLVNNAIDEIGFTPYHWKLFFLNGFGYAVDSLLVLIQAIVSPQVAKEIPSSFPKALIVALYVGLLFGAIFWGLTADMIGRRWAFNISLFMCSIFAIVAGWAESYPVLGLFVALSGFGGGGNLILDTTVFLEFLPSNKQWVLTSFGAWWSVGQTVLGFIAWPYMAKFSCKTAESCTRSNNMGWRYVWWTSGGLVFILSLLRVFIINLKETPKYLLSKGRDGEVVEILQSIALKYNRPCSLTLGQLKACGEIMSNTGNKNDGAAQLKVRELTMHIRGLFLSKKMAISTGLIWFNWTAIGLAFPLYNIFLPEYLSSRGAKFGNGGTFQTYRDFTVANICGIFGPILAGFLCEIPRLGRRGTMVIGALVTMIFLFAYTKITTESQNLAFTSMICFWLNAYYATLYAYTPEVLPSAHRATGNGIAVSFNRIMGIFSALVGTYANTQTSVPIFVCASLFAVIAVACIFLPFEPYGHRSS